MGFRVGEHEYSAGRLNAFEQLHIGRRLAPYLVSITGEGGSLVAIVGALENLSQADLDYIITTSLRVISRKSEGVYAPIYNSSAKMLAFNDITGIQLLEIAAIAIKEDIGPFFQGLVRLVLGTDSPASE